MAMALYTFYQIFKVIDDTTLEALHRTRIGNVTLEAGEAITRGTIVGGIDFFRYAGHEMEVDVERDVYVIKKVYV